MGYKLIAIDMDGTLLNKEKKVTDKTKEAIKRAQALGIYIVITTGRIYSDIPFYKDYIGIEAPVIASNGALIMDGDKTIYKQNISKETNSFLIAISKKFNLKFMLHTHDTLYCYGIRLTLFWKVILRLTGNKNIKIQRLKSYVEVNNLIVNKEKEIIKFEIISLNKNKLELFKEEVIRNKDIEVASSSENNIEVTNKGVSKGNALKFLSDYLKIKKEEIIAIGDSENDISMIRYAGFGVAMGNAIEKVKSEAKYITRTNEEDGVATAIEELVSD